MYYLLDDNIIIESEKLETIKLPKPDVITFKRYDDFFCSTNQIKKQSENVYDLIDWEKDIVRIGMFDRKNCIIDCNINKSDFLDGYYSLDWITAIYKPNEKGDYIKVWEKKDEKEN